MAVIDRIKFDGLRRDWLVYKYPGEDFVLGSQLIVGEGQVAVFVKGGQALDYFRAGTHTLSTSNIPLLQGFVNLPFGRKTPFTAEIFFINITTKLDLAWGTIDPIQLIDPKYNIKLRVRAFGQFGMKVEDYRVFLTELIGSMGAHEVVRYDKVLEYFKGVLIMKVKALIAKSIINKGISALEISASIDEISASCKADLMDEYERFGFKVVNFFIQSINFPDEDFNAINKILQDKAAFDIIGDNRYVTKRSFDTLDSAAQNEGSGGSFVGAGVGLGAGMGMGQAMGGLSANINTGAPAAEAKVACPNCKNQILAGSVFCSFCGFKVKKDPKKCISCSKEISEDVKFCPYCGVLNQKNKVCANCHAKNPEEAAFCIKCGTSLEE